MSNLAVGQQIFLPLQFSNQDELELFKHFLVSWVHFEKLWMSRHTLDLVLQLYVEIV
jgi:hypothetical protein